MTTYTAADPYVYDCPALDRLAQLAGATGDPDEGYPDEGYPDEVPQLPPDTVSRCEAL